MELLTLQCSDSFLYPPQGRCILRATGITTWKMLSAPAESVVPAGYTMHMARLEPIMLKNLPIIPSQKF